MKLDMRAIYRYSRALYELAEKSGQLDKIEAQLTEIRHLVEKHLEITNLVSNSTITLAEKEDFISKIVPAGTLPLLINFLKVLIKKKRFRELALIQKNFHRLYEKQRRIEEVVVVSAVPLSHENSAKLKETLKEKLKSDVPQTLESEIEGIIREQVASSIRLLGGDLKARWQEAMICSSLNRAKFSTRAFLS